MYDIKEIMTSGLKELGINITEEKLVLFERFMELMLEWNEKINLTAITEPEEVLIKHFIDSLVPLCYIEKYGLNLSSSLDLGTGGGFPGVPLKIMHPESRILLADSLKKRITYLDIVIKELGLQNIETLRARAEEMGSNRNYREIFSAVFSRAVAALNILVEYCLPLVKLGGVFVALKGPNLNDELEDAKKAIVLLGGEITGVEQIELPKINDPRTLVFIKKIKTTPNKYPRKPGTPKKSPL